MLGRIWLSFLRWSTCSPRLYVGLRFPICSPSAAFSNRLRCFQSDAGEHCTDASSGKLLQCTKPSEPETTTLINLDRYLLEPSRSLADLLSIDVRSLPSDIRFKSFESVMKKLRTPIPSNETNFPPIDWAVCNWSHRYLYVTHLGRLWNMSFGISPSAVSGHLMAAGVPTEKFDLLVLSTVASANQLTTQQLICLVRYFQNFWQLYDPKVYASLIRLTTIQLNEMSMNEIFLLASVASNFEKQDATVPGSGLADSQVMESEPVTDSIGQLRQEIALLRDATIKHILSKLSGIESFTVLDLIQFLSDTFVHLDDDQKDQIKEALGRSVSLNSRQLNFYNLAFISSRLSVLNWCPDYLIRRLIGSIASKVQLNHGRSDYVSQYIGPALAILANLHVGSPQIVGDDTAAQFHLFACPPLVPGGITPGTGFADQLQFPGLDIARFLNATWVQEMFTQAPTYLINGTAAVRDRKYLMEIAYSLAILGHRADSLLTFAQSSPSGGPADNCPPYPQLIELLVGSGSTEPISVDLQHVSWLPRIEWQVYHRIAAEQSKNLSPAASGSDAQLSEYKHLKQSLVDRVVELFRSRLRRSSPLSLHPFARFRCDPNRPFYFADILFQVSSNRAKDSAKLAACFVCLDRDLHTRGPIEALMNSYNATNVVLPVFTFNFAQLNDPGLDYEKADRFLALVAKGMVRATSIETSSLQIESDEANPS